MVQLNVRDLCETAQLNSNYFVIAEIGTDFSLIDFYKHRISAFANYAKTKTNRNIAENRWQIVIIGNAAQGVQCHTQIIRLKPISDEQIRRDFYFFIVIVLHDFRQRYT